MRLRESKCRGCGASIVWARTANGRPIPLDAKPVRMVTLRPVLEIPIGDDAGSREEVEQAHADVVQAYTPHHATCPKADEFRKN